MPPQTQSACLAGASPNMPEADINNINSANNNNNNNNSITALYISCRTSFDKSLNDMFVLLFSSERM